MRALITGGSGQVGSTIADLLLGRGDAVLSIDTTKGNRILNTRGFAISPTVKEGWILKVAPDLVRLAEIATGRLPVTESRPAVHSNRALGGTARTWRNGVSSPRYQPRRRNTAIAASSSSVGAPSIRRRGIDIETHTSPSPTK